MKFSAAIAVLCSVLVISQGQAFGPVGGMGSGGCVDSSECPDGQCCAGMMPFSGVCRPLAKEGMSCKKDNLFFTGISKITCPCDEGLECVETTVGKKTKGTCQVPPPPPTTVAPVPADDVPASSEESPESPQEPSNPEQSSESDGTSSGESGSAQSAEQSAEKSQESAQEQGVSESEQSEAEAQESGEAVSAGSDDSNAAE